MPNSNLYHGPERRGPNSNGRSWLAERWLQVAPFAWGVGMVMWSVLVWWLGNSGFTGNTPDRRLRVLEDKLDRVLRVTEANAKATCALLTAEQTRLVGLPCADIANGRLYDLVLYVAPGGPVPMNLAVPVPAPRTDSAPPDPIHYRPDERRVSPPANRREETFAVSLY